MELNRHVYPSASNMNASKDKDYMSDWSSSKIARETTGLGDAYNYSRPHPFPNDDLEKEFQKEGVIRSASAWSFEDQVRMIQAWLRVCDSGQCGDPNRYRPSDLCRPLKNNYLPSRLIDVGVTFDPIEVRVVHRNNINEKTADNTDYIALSHCWGLTQDQKDDLAAKEKYQLTDHKDTFYFSEMPQTFQDAVKVCCNLRKRYLWIDSFCIKQGDAKDWEEESQTMNEVFKNAYCTLAATSSENIDHGFLQEPLDLPEQQCRLTGRSDDNYRASYVFERFLKHVNRSCLSKRGWVLQERALSRRTVHFTNKNIFWECGGGVSCATTDKACYVVQSSLSLECDPHFPSSLRNYQYWTQVRLFQDLFCRYSESNLTDATDRPIAIQSLVTELSKAFKSRVEGGVFSRKPYLHDSLLWYRLRPIPQNYKPPNYNKKWKPPSWSWMASEGAIRFLDSGFAANLKFDWQLGFTDETSPNSHFALRSRIVEFEPGQVEKLNKNVNVRRLADVNIDVEKGQLHKFWFDNEGTAISTSIHCAVLGRDHWSSNRGWKYYVLLVTPNGKGKRMKRVGVGCIYECALKFPEGDHFIEIE